MKYYLWKEKISTRKNKKEDNFMYSSIKGIKEFMLKPLLIMPCISNYNITFINIEKKDLNKGIIKKKEYNIHIGDYVIKYIFEENTLSVLCKFYFKNEKNVPYFITQKKVINFESYEIFPMNRIMGKRDYYFEAVIDLDEFKDDEITKIKIETKIQNFLIIPNI